MAITVIVETGAGISEANSYRSTADIDAWVLTNPHDTTWAGLAQVAKDGYAVMSCRVMEEQTDWDGWQTSSTQARDLPRSGMIDKNGNSIDNDEIPTEIQNAQSELARLLAISDRTADNVMKGFKQIEVGPINLVADKADRPVVMADAVWNMISAFGSKSISKGISQVIRT